MMKRDAFYVDGLGYITRGLGTDREVLPSIIFDEVLDQ